MSSYLASPIGLQSLQVASTFVDIMVAAKKRDLLVVFKNFSYLAVVIDIGIRIYGEERRGGSAVGKGVRMIAAHLSHKSDT